MSDSIRVAVVEYSARKFYLLQWRDPITGDKKTKSSGIEKPSPDAGPRKRQEIEDAVANLLYVAAACFVVKQKVPPLVVAEPVAGLRKNVLRIAPDEVRRVAVTDDDTHVAAIHVGGD